MNLLEALISMLFRKVMPPKRMICKGKGNEAVTILHCDECDYQTTKKYNLKRHNLPGKYYGKLLASAVCLSFPRTLVIQLVLTSSTWIVFENFILFSQRMHDDLIMFLVWLVIGSQHEISVLCHIRRQLLTLALGYL